MNSALFASAFYPSVGGVQEVVRQLGLGLARRGDRALIITNRWPKTLPESETYEGLPVRRYVFRVPEPNFKQLGGSLLLGPGTLRRICNDLEAHEADVIHVHCVSSNAYYALKAKRRLGLPLVVTLHGELSMDANGLFEHSAFARSVLRQILDEADAITACSEQTLVEAESFYGESLRDRAQVVYSGIRLEDFQNVTPYKHTKPYVLGIGRLVKQKGFDVLLRAFAQTALSGDVSHDLLLAGEGEEASRLLALATELQIVDRVHFLGRVDRALAAELFAGCSFFVLPSRQEPMGIVNLEAMASGKAVIASKVGGVPELVSDGQTGLLVPPEDVSALATEMRRLMDNADLRQRLGNAGTKRARGFDWDSIVSQFSDIYRSVCSRPESARSCVHATA